MELRGLVISPFHTFHITNINASIKAKTLQLPTPTYLFATTNVSALHP